MGECVLSSISRRTGLRPATLSAVGAVLLAISISILMAPVPGAGAVTANIAGSATVSSSSSGGITAITDRASQSPARDVGASWTGTSSAEWIELRWTTTEVVTSVSVFGSPTAPASVASAMLRFSDGTSIPVGGVLRDGIRPTTVAFAAKSVAWVRFEITAVSGSGGFGIGEIAVHRVGSTPQKSMSISPPDAGIGIAVSTEPECLAGARTAGLTVLCPRSNTTIQGTTTMKISAPGATSVVARVWQSSTSPYPEPAPITVVPDGRGIATLAFDAARLAHGPINVELRAFSGSTILETVWAQLFNGSGPQTPRLLPSPASFTPSSGMTLAYSEEFTAPVSFSRTGVGADYASAKPEWWGANEFGQAVFADPSAGYDNLTVVDDDFLKIALKPLPAGVTDPNRWGRGHIGGMLSSARVGGSGFSAQYGYFEARMLAPGGKGIWPAFWLLPNDNLPSAQSIVAEIDVVEIYGHNPMGNCQSIHSYRSGVATSKNFCGTRFDSVQLGLEWHTYGVKVGTDNVVYYIDGRQVATVPQVPGGDSPMFFMANFALSDDWPIDLAATGDEAALYVDYIRVYT